jgi:uncharacterized YigZ family protein
MRTLDRPATFEAEIKRSRFIAHSARVDTLADTLSFYESVADPQASHNCWAWRLDHQYRFNDDGEPASTAGKPILAAIEGKELDHVMIVVSRYFGGIKLGVGGLVRAYGGSASKCLDQAEIVEILPSIECTVQAAFNWTGQIYSALDSCQADKLSEQHGENGIRVKARLLKTDFEKLRALLRDTTRGQAVIRVSD